MTKEEALVFLELPATATAAEIKSRIADRLLQYETLSEKAPSDFLRRLNTRKLDSIKNLIKESVQWPSFAATPVPVNENSDKDDVVEEAQTVYIVPSLKESVVKAAAAKGNINTRAPGEPAGWLIKHTEDQLSQTYPLQPGKNFLGRKKQAAMEPFIVIEADDFISRVQCVIYAEDAAVPTFHISDAAEFNNGKTSKNGTFVNGDTNRVTIKRSLNDGDTIQLGITKFIVRCNAAPLETIIHEVEHSGYIDTVLLED